MKKRLRFSFSKLSIVCCFAVLLMTSQPVRGAFIIEVVDASIQVNSVGYVDVLISGGATDANLATALYAFQISEIGSTVGTINFLGFERPSGSNYVFADDLADFPIDFIDEGGGVYASSGDGTASGLDIVVPGGQMRNLVRLNLQHQLQANTSADLAVGNQYSIGLVNNSLLTAFSSELDPDLEIDLSSFTPGTLTITAVPEPGSLVLVGSVLCGGLLMRYRKRTASKTVVS